MAKGFLEDIFNSIALNAAVQLSRRGNSKPDPYKAAGIVYGFKGDLSDSDIAQLGTLLGAQDAFEETEDED